MDTPKAHTFSPQKHADQCALDATLDCFLPELPAHCQDEVRLKLNDFDLLSCLNAREISTRFNLLAIFIPISLKQLLLRAKTVDIGIRLFDYFYFRKIKAKGTSNVYKSKAQKVKNITQGHFLESKGRSKTVLMACLFLAAKYNQVYPPALSDFLYFLQENLSKYDLLELQKEILLTTQHAFTTSTMYEWFSLLSNQRMPQWALMIYCHSLNKAEHLARAVHFVCESEKENALVTSSSKLNRVLRILGLKKFTEKSRKTLNQIKTATKAKGESTDHTCLKEKEKEKIDLALQQLRFFLETKNAQKHNE